MEPLLPVTSGNIRKAKAFVMKKWVEREREFHARDELYRAAHLPFYLKHKPDAAHEYKPREFVPPSDLSDGCKFSSYFCSIVFGGKMAGNYDHYFVILPNGSTLDLNDEAKDVADMMAAHFKGEGGDPYRVDDLFMAQALRPDRKNVSKRVADWLNEFCEEQRLPQRFVRTASGAIKPVVQESPIEDIHLIGGPKHYPMGSEPPMANRERDLDAFKQGHTFGDQDSKLIQAPKAQAKIYRAFSKTPHRFEIIFQNGQGEVTNSPEDNRGVDRIAKDTDAGVHDFYGNIPGKPGVIRVLLVSNLSPLDNKMPMTAWTVAHKIGHSFQDHMSGRETKPDDISMAARRLKQSVQTVPASYLTMKSARDRKLTNKFENFAEIVAQYLITGRFTVDRRPGTDSEEYYQWVEQRANFCLDQLFSLLVGKVLVEV